MLTKFYTNKEMLSQFIIDPSSFTLKERVHMDDPILPEFFRVIRNFCFVVDKRMRASVQNDKSNKENQNV